MPSPLPPAVPTVAALVLLGATFGAFPPLAAQLQVPTGFQGEAKLLPRPAKGWVGLDRLRDGHLVAFDGVRLVQLDPATGSIRKTLTSLATPVFGTDVRVGPSKDLVFFGESSTGAIHEHTLPTGKTRLVTKLGGNFSFAFHPEEGERFLYASAHPGFTGTAKVFRIDIVTGAHDLIAEAEGFAGPIAFDASANLLFAPGPKAFGKPGRGKILRWARTQVLGAIGKTSLMERDAVVFAQGFDNAIDLAFDGEGTLYAADAFAKTSSSLLELGPIGGSFATGVFKASGEYVTSVLFAPAAPPFERFGAAGSELWLLTTDFQAITHLVRLAPLRPALTVRPSIRPPKGTPLRYDGTGQPARGFALWLLGAGLVPEKPLLPLGAGGLAFPSFGVVPTAPLLAVVTPIDSNGRSALSFPAPNVAPVQWTTQILAGPVSPLRGGTPASLWVTSNAVRVITQ